MNTVRLPRRAFASTMLVLIIALAMSTVVFADSISDKVNGGLKEVYSTITAITVPAGAVVVAGSRPIHKGPGAEDGIHVYTPVIVKYRDSKTDASVELEDLLR